MVKINENKCGECTLCCTHYPIEELNKPANVACYNLCSTGCSIYDTRPKVCSDYECAWRQEEKVTIELRPDKSGIMFTKLDEQIMYGLVDPLNTPTNLGKQQIHEFLKQGYSVVMFDYNKPNYGFFISPTHDEIDIRNLFNEYIIKHNKR